MHSMNVFANLYPNNENKHSAYIGECMVSVYVLISCI